MTTRTLAASSEDLAKLSLQMAFQIPRATSSVNHVEHPYYTSHQRLADCKLQRESGMVKDVGLDPSSSSSSKTNTSKVKKAITKVLSHGTTNI